MVEFVELVIGEVCGHLEHLIEGDVVEIPVRYLREWGVRARKMECKLEQQKKGRFVVRPRPRRPPPARPSQNF